MVAQTEKRWTPEELAEHWGIPCDRGFWRLVDDHNVPFIYLGHGQPTKGRAGQRGFYRFRPESILAWERGRERTFGDTIPMMPGAVAGERPAPATVASLHDGKVRGGRKGSKRKGVGA